LFKASLVLDEMPLADVVSGIFIGKVVRPPEESAMAAWLRPGGIRQCPAAYRSPDVDRSRGFRYSVTNYRFSEYPPFARASPP
jgi:hypothetical protein